MQKSALTVVLSLVVLVAVAACQNAPQAAPTPVAVETTTPAGHPEPTVDVMAIETAAAAEVEAALHQKEADNLAVVQLHQPTNPPIYQSTRRRRTNLPTYPKAHHAQPEKENNHDQRAQQHERG